MRWALGVTAQRRRCAVAGWGVASQSLPFGVGNREVTGREGGGTGCAQRREGGKKGGRLQGQTGRKVGHVRFIICHYKVSNTFERSFPDHARAHLYSILTLLNLGIAY
jgi:hypothetical protein